jgi:PKD repeat protein
MFFVTMLTVSVGLVALASALPPDMVPTSPEVPTIGAGNGDLSIDDVEVINRIDGNREYSGPDGPRPQQAPGFYQTSEYMLGSITVAVILPESDGSVDTSTEDWSTGERNNVRNEVRDGVMWWWNKAHAHGMYMPSLTMLWSHINTPVTTSYEPINRCSTCSSGQGLWINQIMTKLGFSAYSSYRNKVRHYNNYLRTTYNTDWAYTIFVVDSSNDGDNKFTDGRFGYAYLGGPFVVMTYGNNGWGIGRMNLVTAHEQGHIFYALDEYAASGCSPTAKGGYLGRINSNCENGGTGHSNIMNDNRLSSPSPRIETREQVGWRDSDGDGIEDIRDTFPRTTLNTYSPDPTPDFTPTFSGNARVVPLPEKNPYSSVSTSINKISYVLLSIDGGPYMYPAYASDGRWDEANENFLFTTPTLSSGTHTICARARNSAGNTGSSSCDTLTIDSPPRAYAGPDQIVNEGATVFFNGGGSTDDFGIVSYDWNFGDGSPHGSGVTPTHEYGDNGVYKVTLTVRDTSGQTSTDIMYVNVQNVAPAVNAGVDQTINEGDTVTISSAFSDKGWLDTHTATINWGEGTIDTGTVSEENVKPDATGTVAGSHTYGDNGAFTVTVTVCDDDGACTADTLSVTVRNVAPSVASIPSATIMEGQSVSFVGTAGDPGSDDLTFKWSWGFRSVCDSTQTYLNDPLYNPDPSPSPTVNPRSVSESRSCQYGDNGVFTVTLTVSDDDGLSTTVTTTVTVNNVAPSVASLPSLTMNEGQTASFTGRATDPGSDDLTFSWSWGYRSVCDSTTTHLNAILVGPDPFPSPTVNPRSVSESRSCQYGDDGVFTVTLTVTDDDGLATTATTTVTVNTVNPTIDPTVRVFVKVDVTLRAAGEKWHDVELTLYESGTVTDTASVTRYPGDPDDQSVTVNSVEMDILACSSSADVVYTPMNDPENGEIWGATPVWVILTFEDGTEVWLNHTFNVRHPGTWTWTISDFCPYISAAGVPIYFEATASDVGSDDLTFTWSWGDATADTSTTYFNNGASADPYPSPDINPITETDTVSHTYSSSGTYNITLKVTDDDTGQATKTITLTI